MRYEEFRRLKVGDVVRVVSIEEVERIKRSGESTVNFTPLMRKYCENTYSVASIGSSYVTLVDEFMCFLASERSAWIWRFGYHYIQKVEDEDLPLLKIDFDALL